MEERASAESKLRGSKPVKLELTVAGMVIAARFGRSAASHGRNLVARSQTSRAA